MPPARRKSVAMASTTAMTSPASGSMKMAAMPRRPASKPNPPVKAAFDVTVSSQLSSERVFTAYIVDGGNGAVDLGPDKIDREAEHDGGADDLEAARDTVGEVEHHPGESVGALRRSFGVR